MRTAEVARLAGCSVQQVRKLEDRGVLPPAPRTDAGYREYRAVHLASALAYRSLATAIGPTEARVLMRLAHRAVSMPPTQPCTGSGRSWRWPEPPSMTSGTSPSVRSCRPTP